MRNNTLADFFVTTDLSLVAHLPTRTCFTHILLQKKPGRAVWLASFTSQFTQTLSLTVLMPEMGTCGPNNNFSLDQVYNLALYQQHI